MCPESIHITDNGIIPLKERVADDYYDPVRWLRAESHGRRQRRQKAKLPVIAATTDGAEPTGG